MTTIFYAEPELVLAHGRKVLFLNPNDLQIFKEIELPLDLATCGLKVAAIETAAQQRPAGSQKGEGKATAGANAEVAILNVSYSPDRQLIAVTTGGQKALLLYQSRPENAKLLSARALARASSALTFAADSSSVLVTDKTGDCYQYDCVEVEATPRLLLGHLSIVYDILWTSDQQHIITCDRDDKIRVTNYPATFDIHSYCLGHKEFVSGLALLTGDYLVSVSGDRTLRVWNFMSGKELLCYELPAPAVRLQVREEEPDKHYRVAVLLYNHSQAIGLYDLALDEQTPEIWTIAREQLVCAEAGAWNISNLTLTENRIYVVGAQDERLALRVYNTKDGEQAKNVPSGWLEMVTERYADQKCVPDDLSVWFKKRFDNVSEYMERKKRRIEDQQQQKS